LGVEESTLPNRWSLFTCEVCLRIFSQPEKYYRHIKEKHGVRREFFADEFASIGIDLQHAWQKVCDEKERLKDAAKYSGYESGRKATKKRLFYCKICKINFGTDKGLFRHARNHHESDKSYSCKKCQVKFPTKFLLFAHEKECEKKDATYPCEKCETKFTVSLMCRELQLWSNIIEFSSNVLHVLMLLHFMMTFSVSSRWWSCFESPFHALAFIRKPSPVLSCYLHIFTSLSFKEKCRSNRFLFVNHDGKTSEMT